MKSDHTKEEAEIVGIVLGDGSLYKNKKREVYQFVITGHKNNDKRYFESFVLPLLNKNFGNNFRLYNSDRNSVRIRSQKKSVVENISKLGLPFGSKISNNVKIPEWVYRNKSFLKACIRGMVDTDGSVSPITGRNYSYIWFTSQIPALQKSFSRAMKMLGIKTSKWNHRTSHGSQVYIGSKLMLEKYFKEINFNNPYHKRRFRVPIV